MVTQGRQGRKKTVPTSLLNYADSPSLASAGVTCTSRHGPSTTQEKAFTAVDAYHPIRGTAFSIYHETRPDPKFLANSFFLSPDPNSGISMRKLTNDD